MEISAARPKGTTPRVDGAAAGLFFEAVEAAGDSVQAGGDQCGAEGKTELASSGRQLCIHVGSEHGVDSRLLALLFSQPFQEIRIQADRDGLFCLRNDYVRLSPKLRIGRSRLGIARDGAPDLPVAQGSEALPITAVLN